MAPYLEGCRVDDGRGFAFWLQNAAWLQNTLKPTTQNTCWLQTEYINTDFQLVSMEVQVEHIYLYKCILLGIWSSTAISREGSYKASLISRQRP